MTDVDPPETHSIYYHRFNSKLTDGERAWLFGVVTAVRKSKLSTFIDLLHALGTTQLVADKSKLASTWTSVESIRIRDRIKIKGTIGRTQRGALSLFLDDCPILANTFLNETLDSNDRDYRQIGGSILIAQARNVAEEFLRTQNYRRVDPRYISASWPSEQGMTPLQVNYPGFGMPVFLAPSPAEQLVLALAATGDDRVFCSATSFTTSYRQPSDGSESSIVMAMSIGLGIKDLLVQCTSLIDKICEAMPGVTCRFPSGSIREEPHTMSDLVTSHSTNLKASAWVFPVINGVEPFRIVLENGVTPIEGCVEHHDEGVDVATIVFYAERVLPLAQHTEFRRLLRHLGGPIVANTGAR